MREKGERARVLRGGRKGGIESCRPFKYASFGTYEIIEIIRAGAQCVYETIFRPVLYLFQIN